MTPVRAFSDVTPERFREEIVPLGQPALLKGLVADWPAVKRAKQSDEAIIDYLKACDNGRPAEAMLGAPRIKGEFFYGETLDSFNFQKGTVAISTALDRIIEQKPLAEPYAVYVQSTPVAAHLPRFKAENVIELISAAIEPRIWIGNALRTQTHYDLSNNIACLVAGRRRFTLFAPEQLVNLYPGPIESTLSGTPVSMASLENPDFERHPRFREALETALIADLEPGDAIYMPYFWWHHVRSFEPFNVLVNYWWNEQPAGLGSPYNALLHGLLSLRELPQNQRDIWRTMFDYYVFGSHGDPVGHLKPQEKGALGPMGAAMTERMKRQLVNGLIRDWKIKPGG